MSIRTEVSSSAASYEAVPAHETTLGPELDIEELTSAEGLTPEMMLTLASARLADIDGQIEALMDAMNATTAQATAVRERISQLRELQNELEPAFDTSGNLDPTRPISGPNVVQDGADFLDELVARGEMTADERDLVLSGPDGFRQLLSRRGGDGSDILRGTNTHNAFISAGFADAAGNFLPNERREVPRTVDRHLAELVERGLLSETEATAILEGGRSALSNTIQAANDELTAINSNNEMMMIKLQSAMQNRSALITSTTNLLKSFDEGRDAVVANLR